MTKRILEIVVLSDIHLGTVGCNTIELLQYLNSIDPKMIALNGDFIDVWNFRKYYWPESHMIILRQYGSILPVVLLHLCTFVPFFLIEP